MQHYLAAIPTLYKGVILGAGVVILLLLAWLWSRYNRHRYVVIRPSEPVQTIAVQLGRIADSVDYLARSIEAARPSSTAEGEESKHVTMSALGR